MKDATLVQHMAATLKQLLEALLTNLEAKVINAAVTLVICASASSALHLLLNT